MTRSSTRVDFLEVPPKLCTMFSIGMFEFGFLLNYNIEIRVSKAIHLL
jgi:hypothetical protein